MCSKTCATAGKKAWCNTATRGAENGGATKLTHGGTTYGFATNAEKLLVYAANLLVTTVHGFNLSMTRLVSIKKSGRHPKPYKKTW